MKLISGDSAYEILARGHHYSHHYSHHYGGSHGTSDGVMDWWEWLILGIGLIAVVWSMVKKFSSD